MIDKFTFSSAGEAQEVEFALARHGWTHALLKKATSGDSFGRFREVIKGYAEICPCEHLIDCDTQPSSQPYQTSELKVHAHTPGGKLVFNRNTISLYMTEEQKKRGIISGCEFLKQATNKSPLNANVLDYLLANPDLIPEEWKNKIVLFFGTIYRDVYGLSSIRYCYCLNDKDWRWDRIRLNCDWRGENYFAAVLRS